MYKKITTLLTKKDKKFLLILVFLSIFLALVETAGVTIIMPFISVASNFETIHEKEYFTFFFEYFGFTDEINFVLWFGISIIIFYLFRGLFNIFYFYLLSKFSKGRTHLLSFRLFENYLGMSYHDFINRNSSELTKTIINETQYLTIMISAILLMISEVFVVCFIYGLMLYMNWKITIIISLILFCNGLFLILTVSKKIKQQGKAREEYQKKFFEIINSTFSNYKMIKLQSNDKVLIEKFNKASYGFAKSNIISDTLAHIPRLFIETLGFGIVAFVVIFLVFKNQTDISSMLGLLSMFVLGLYRLMPSVNRLLSGYNQLMYYHKALDIIHNDLMYDNENLGNEKIVFNDSISLNNINFGYTKDKIILNNIDLKLNKNEKIAFIGPSGSGKSTLVDIIIGLYKPNKGDIVVDNMQLNEKNIRNWRSKVGYIPQSVYLFDGSVAQNISFGQEYDEDKIKEALKKKLRF